MLKLTCVHKGYVGMIQDDHVGAKIVGSGNT